MVKALTASLAKFIATFAYSGMVKKAPGTMGSFATIIAFIALASFEKQATIAMAININIMLVLCGAIFLVGIKATEIYMNNTGKHDPKEVVIDEVVGQLITIAIAAPVLKNITSINDQVFLSFIISCFIFFRFFDIVKPWPIKYIDNKVNNAHGVMLDDVVAGIFAGIITRLIFSLMV